MTWGDAGTPITAVGKSTAATLAFRVGGELHVAAVVKATFVLAPDGPMVLVDPEPILRIDELRDRSPASSLVASGDLVPYRPRADVLLHGHARAPRDQPTPAMAVRLMVAQGADVVIDKRLVVRGVPDPSGRTREPSPFAAMRLSWELSAGTPDNPVGIRETPHAWPHVVDPRRRDQPAGFGPISPRWPSRRRLLELAESVFDAPIPELPRDFAWAYFNAAPEDQRVDFFRGDEWIGFEGMNSQLPRVQSYLPGVVGRARVYGPEAPLLGGQPISLEADTVIIDTDRLRCSVVWRGSFPVAHERVLAALQVFAGVETAEQPLSFPASYGGRQGAASFGVTTTHESAKETSRTLEVEAHRVVAATPFGPSNLPPRPAPQRPLPAATPFERARLVPAPPPGDRDATADVSALSSSLRFADLSSPDAPAPDSGGTKILGDLLSGQVLPFGEAHAQPAPRAEPAPVHDGAPLDRSRALPQTPVHDGAPLDRSRALPQTPAPPMALDAESTRIVSTLFLGNVLPFLVEEAPPPEAEAPRSPVLAPCPLPPAAGDTVAANVLPGAGAPEPAPELPASDSPPALGAFFLAAMARSGRRKPG